MSTTVRSDPTPHTRLQDAMQALQPTPAPSAETLAALAEPGSADRMMRAAMQSLASWQAKAAKAPDAEHLPAWDEARLGAELQLFVDWCVQREHGRSWNGQQQAWWARCRDALLRACLSQPQLPLHGQISPQGLGGSTALAGLPEDAATQRGPLGYDLAALLRDAELAWDEGVELDWAIRYWEQARKLGLLGDAEAELATDFGEFWRVLEWTGLQRHLRELGLRCRAKHRDGQPQSGAAMDRLYAYATKVSTRYVELAPLTRLLQDLRQELVQDGFVLR